MKPGDLVRYAVPKPNGKISHWEVGTVLCEPWKTGEFSDDYYVEILGQRGSTFAFPLVWVEVLK